MKGSNSFLLLLSLNTKQASVAKAVLARIKANVDPHAAPLWIDSSSVGVFITTDLPAHQVWRHAYPESLSLDERNAMQTYLIVQVGPGFAGPPDSKFVAWLNSRFPRH